MAETKAEKAEAKAEKEEAKAAEDITNRIVIQTSYQGPPNISRYEGYTYWAKS
jgi:hypothetical protein